MLYDVVIIGGGPAGLAAALNLGRARKRVLLCEAGTPRNAAATHVYGFLTRDGTPPAEMRAIARAQLQRYPNVEVRDARVEAITGDKGAFKVRTEAGSVEARRILLASGLIDEPPDLDGMRALWGRSVFQCPYCHGWEAQDRRFGYLASRVEMAEFPLLLRGWTHDVTLFTNAGFALNDDLRARLAQGGVRIEERKVARLVAGGDGLLARIDVDEGSLPLDVLFVHPHQKQTPLVQSLDLALDDAGFVKVNEQLESSRPGIYAAGDAATQRQSAVLAAGAGMLAAAMMNMGLTLDLAAAGLLPPRP
jgi:thioredoxin reductase